MADRDALGRFTEGNISGSSSLGFAVGNLAFLESEQSRAGKYFRSIEFGTQGFEGRKLVGLFGSGTRGVVGGDLTAIGRGAGQQFFPIGWTPHPDLDSPKAALKYLRETDQPLNIKGIVKHEIAPKEAYEHALASFDPVARELEAIKQAFANAGIGSGDVKGRSRTSAASRSQFLSRNLRGRFLTGSVLSVRSQALAKVDAVFRAELTTANRLLAQGLAAEVALYYKDNLKRPLTSSGKLEEATLDSRNRFPV